MLQLSKPVATVIIPWARSKADANDGRIKHLIGRNSSSPSGCRVLVFLFLGEGCPDCLEPALMINPPSTVAERSH
jgi:hypothetical protein